MDLKEPEYKRVVAYIRKSSEDNEKGQGTKQLNSIDYQRQFVKDAIERQGLELVRQPFEDDKTGYEAYVRDGFREMVEYLKEHKTEVDGIVCTEISRLARNFGDGGVILWYMQSNIVKRIYTHSKMFTNSSADQLMVAIEFAMSKKSSDDTGMRTVQGMYSKARTMKHPARPAILGYFTQGPSGRKEWIIDPTTGPLVRQVFEQFATGKYTFEQITEYAYLIGLRSVDGKNRGGKLSENTWMNRLKDHQYTGIFESDGESIVGEYEAIVDPELFYTVQEVMHGNRHPKETHLDYAYSHIVTCGLCGGPLSGTHKKGITYYRCSKRQEPCKSTARITYIPEKKLESTLMDAFETIEIDQETWKASKDYVSELNQPQKLDLREQIQTLNGRIEAEETMQTNLGRKYANNEFSKPEYNKLMADSHAKTTSLKTTLIKCENIINELDELMAQFLDNIKYVNKRLRHALPLNKREMVEIFCENLVWKDEKVGWDWKKPYYFIAKEPKSSTMLPG